MIIQVFSKIPTWLVVCLTVTGIVKCDTLLVNQSILLPEVTASLEQSVCDKGEFVVGMAIAFLDRKVVWQLVDGMWKTTSTSVPLGSRYTNQQLVCRIALEPPLTEQAGGLQWFKFRKWEWKYRSPEMPRYGQTGNEYIDWHNWLRMYYHDRDPSGGCLDLPNWEHCLLAFLQPIDISSHFEKLVEMNSEKSQDSQEVQTDYKDARRNLPPAPETGTMPEPIRTDFVISLELDQTLGTYNSFCQFLGDRLPEVLPVDEHTEALCKQVFEGAIRVMSVVVIPLDEDIRTPDLSCCLSVTGSTPDNHWFCTLIRPDCSSQTSAEKSTSKDGRKIQVYWRETNSYRAFE